MPTVEARIERLEHVVLAMAILANRQQSQGLREAATTKLETLITEIGAELIRVESLDT